MALFCTCGRARWGDAQHSQYATWDTDDNNVIRYVECATAIHKTCRALSMRHMFLPLTAPGIGASELNCATLWKDARDTLDIGNLNKYLASTTADSAATGSAGRAQPPLEAQPHSRTHAAASVFVFEDLTLEPAMGRGSATNVETQGVAP